MSSTLREQLLKAGLVTEKQVRESERPPRQQNRPQRAHPGTSPGQPNAGRPLPGDSPGGPAGGRPRHPGGRNQPPPPTEQQIAAQQRQAAKAARDAELNRQRKLAAEAKERAVQIKQLIGQHKLPKVESDDRFHFVAGKKLRFILVDGPMREGLNRGTLFIIRYNGQSEVVPAEAAERIRERDERAVVQLKGEERPPDTEDPYKDFVVPDDLKW